MNTREGGSDRTKGGSEPRGERLAKSSDDPAAQGHEDDHANQLREADQSRQIHASSVAQAPAVPA